MKLADLTAVVVLGLILNSVTASVVPGRWEKVEVLSEGFPVTVKLKSGSRIKAYYVGLTEDGLLLGRESGDQLEVPKPEVAEVTSQERNANDGLRNGAIIGGMTGGIFALSLGLALADGDDKAYVALVTAIYSAIGMGAGVGIDAIIKGHEVYYEAPGK
jgi:hypothetical protein